MGVQASMDDLSKQILTQFYNIAKQKTVHNFLRLSVLEILEKYGSKLFASPGSFYPEISIPQDSKEAI